MSNESALNKTNSWTTTDLRNAASNWNLTGDRALLEILKNFHQNVQQQTSNVIDRLDSLNSEFGNTSLSLKNVNNRFIGLNNTQFVERTIQEDEPEIIKTETDRHNDSCIITEIQGDIQKESFENEKKEKILKVVGESIKRLEGLCERIEISTDSETDSDGDTEDNIQRSVLKLKDLYSDYHLPHMIGSNEWKRKWHIGLHDNSSESETEEINDLDEKKDDQRYSSNNDLVDDNDRKSVSRERKTQMTLPIPKLSTDQPSGVSPGSSNTNYSTDTEDLEVAKINANVKENDNLSDKQDKQTPAPRLKASDFAAELAKKLAGGNLVNQPTNTNMSQGNNRSEGMTAKSDSSKPKTAKVPFGSATRGISGNIFSDEPPPLDADSSHDDKDDLFGSIEDEDNDSLHGGLFSNKPQQSNRGTGLFSNSSTSKYGNLFSDLPDDQDNDDNMPSKQAMPKKQTNKGLFDDDSDEELFISNVSKTTTIKKENVDNRPTTNAKNSTKEITSQDDSDSSVEIKRESSMSKQSNTPVKPIAKGLFDDSDDDGSSDLFGGNLSFVKKVDPPKSTKIPQDSVAKPAKKTISNIFEDSSEDDDDLFKSLKPAVKTTPEKPKPISTQEILKVEPKVIKTEEVKKPSEEDLFAAIRIPEKKPVVPIESEKDLNHLEKDDQKVAEKNSPAVKKPAGGVSIFGDNANILKGPNSIASIIEKRKQPEEIDEHADVKTSVPQSNINTPDTDQTKIKTGPSTKYNSANESTPDIFKNTTSLENTDNIPKMTTDTEKSNNSESTTVKTADEVKELSESRTLFEDSESLELPPPLEIVKETINAPQNADSLFGYEDDDDDEDLFSSLKGRNTEKSYIKYQGSSLFDDDMPEHYRDTSSSNLFNDEPPDLNFTSNDNKVLPSYFETTETSDTGKDIVDQDVKSSEINTDTVSPPIEDKKIKSQSIFEDSSDDDGDLFSSLLKKTPKLSDGFRNDNKENVLKSADDPKPVLIQSKLDVPVKPEIKSKPNTNIVPKSKDKSFKTNNPLSDSSETECLGVKEIAKDDKDTIKDENDSKSNADKSSPEKLVTESSNNNEPKIEYNEDSKSVDNSQSENQNVSKSVTTQNEVLPNSNVQQIISKLGSTVESSVTDVREEIDGNVSSSLSPDKGKIAEQNHPTFKNINKLKSNLSINVKALIPGSAPLLRKKADPDVPPSMDTNPTSPDEPIGFDQPNSSTDSVLANNYSKDKIKIQVKRRPQSRKARHEAARRSAADLLYSFDSTSKHPNYSLPNSPTQEEPSDSFSSLNSDITSSLESSASEYLASTVQTIGNAYANKNVLNIRSMVTNEKHEVLKVESKIKEQKIVAPTNEIQHNDKDVKQKHLFDDLNDDIFSASKVVTKKSLFEEDEDSDDLFAGLKQKSAPKTKTVIEEPLKPTQGAIKKEISVITKGVFDNSDSDSDLFSSKPKKKSTKESTTIKSNKMSKKSSLFGDSDTEDDLFTTIPKKTLDISKQLQHKSLFGDDLDDDDGDIFKSSSSKKKPQKIEQTQNVSKTKQSTSEVQKTTTTQVAGMDPLSSFLNDI